MYRIILTVLFSCAAMLCFAQQPKLKTTEILNSGCLYKAPVNKPVFEISYSEDSSKLFTAQSDTLDFSFGIILVHLNNSFEDDSTECADLLESYLNYLQEAWIVTSASGYSWGRNLNTNRSAVGIHDNWVIENKTTTRVQGWIINDWLVVLYIDGDKVSDALESEYFQGFRFPNN